MKQLTLNVTTREKVGRGVSRRLRQEGNVPAVIYGRSGSRSLSIDGGDFQSLLRKMHGGAAIIEIADDKGAKALSVLQEVQRDPCTDKFIHADFHEVSKDHMMTVTLPVHTVGESIGVKNENGSLEIPTHEIEIRCLPQDLPEFIEVDVSELHTGESIHVKDLKPLSGVTYQSDPEVVLVVCTEERFEEKADSEEVVVEEKAPSEPSE